MFAMAGARQNVVPKLKIMTQLPVEDNNSGTEMPKSRQSSFAVHEKQNHRGKGVEGIPPPPGFGGHDMKIFKGKSVEDDIPPPPGFSPRPLGMSKEEYLRLQKRMYIDLNDKRSSSSRAGTARGINIQTVPLCLPLKAPVEKQTEGVKEKELKETSPTIPNRRKSNRISHSSMKCLAQEPQKRKRRCTKGQSLNSNNSSQAENSTGKNRRMDAHGGKQAPTQQPSQPAAHSMAEKSNYSPLHATSNDVNVFVNPLAETMLAELRGFVNYLEDNFSRPVVDAPEYPLEKVNELNELQKAHERLSHLLSLDFRILIEPENLAEVVGLSAKLQKDTSLDAVQLKNLSLIEKLPLVSNDILKMEWSIKLVNRFFLNLKDNMARFTSLKVEHENLKKAVSKAQAEVNVNTSCMQDIETQILHLQTCHAELATAVESKEATMKSLTTSKNEIFNALTRINNDIEDAMRRKPWWEEKQQELVHLKANILSNYSFLKGFSVLLSELTQIER
ncbi:uncharacterized protein LOC131146329 isoform X2 [Malania oleifera]|nr:uncharacterized protein LOC131146329 isoform X2 [Malania oleifera]XP_057951859.1 uncharacterized protein LOC131146329 isoform X2 [Malania oleifera]XP_057951860.1 uncharacterized protein LOC131146329 isoform X2 [Malania oleifera]XP_057951861.1 uncharacterized protein LOC131146329 isoform X2 [Malania oleifera]